MAKQALSIMLGVLALAFPAGAAASTSPMSNEAFRAAHSCLAQHGYRDVVRADIGGDGGNVMLPPNGYMAWNYEKYKTFVLRGTVSKVHVWFGGTVSLGAKKVAVACAAKGI